MSHASLIVVAGCAQSYETSFMPNGNYNWMPLSTKLPTKDDFDPYGGDLDAESAWREFGGMTLDQAYQHFLSNPLCHQEDFMFMGPVAFCYYFPVIERHLHAFRIECEEEHEAWILAHALMTQLENLGVASNLELVKRIGRLADYVIKHIHHFETDPDEQSRILKAWHKLREFLSPRSSTS